MIKFKILALACALAFATPAFAQFTTGGGSSSRSASTGSADIVPSYNMIGVSYTNVDLKPKHGEGIGLNGFSINYLHGFGLSQTMPMYLETGVKFSMGFDSDSYEEEGYYEDYSVEVRQMLASVAVPVNFAWRIQVNDRFAVKPYVGLNLKLHILGQTKFSYDDEDDSETYNWFDKDDMGEKYNRFQIGWHIGAGIQYSKLYLGVSYGTDFSKIAKNTSTGTFDVTLGYCF